VYAVCRSRAFAPVAALYHPHVFEPPIAAVCFRAHLGADASRPSG
jgi:hypothetical protein